MYAHVGLKNRTQLHTSIRHIDKKKVNFRQEFFCLSVPNQQGSQKDQTNQFFKIFLSMAYCHLSAGCPYQGPRLSIHYIANQLAPFPRRTIFFKVAGFSKFIYSVKATKFYEISNLLLSVCNVDKSKVEIPQNFVALSEYTNFTVQI